MLADTLAVGSGYTAGFLTAMLKRIKPEIGKIGSGLVIEYTENSAVFLFIHGHLP
jgi:hypothetical protein